MENETDGINEQMSTLLDQMGKNKDNPDPMIDQFIQTMGWDLINKRLAAIQDREDQERRELAMDAWEDFGNPMDKFRGTGRTTRMLEYAIKKAASGKEVVVYGGWQRFCEDLGKTAMNIASKMSGYYLDPLNTPSYKLRFIAKKVNGNTFGTILFKPMSRIMDKFDWVTLREPDLPRTTVTLVDHWLIEKQYSEICRELYKFMPDPIRENDKENNQDKIPPEPPEPNITAL